MANSKKKIQKSAAQQGIPTEGYPSSILSTTWLLTIPFKLRLKLGLKPGDKVDWESEGGRLVLRPVKLRKTTRHEDGYGMLNYNGKMLPDNFDVATLLTKRGASKVEDGPKILGYKGRKVTLSEIKAAIASGATGHLRLKNSKKGTFKDGIGMIKHDGPPVSIEQMSATWRPKGNKKP